MKLTKCSNGHFYDAEKYPTCPHCAGGGAAGYSGEDKKTDCIIPENMGQQMKSSDMNGYGRGVNQNINGERVTIGFDDWQGQKKTGENTPLNKKVTEKASEDDHTHAYINWNLQDKNKQNEEKVTDYTLNKAPGGKPVVGWLVCVEGNHYGSCFNLFGGKNFIGRSTDMDICLSGDITVSRVKHAIIIYEPKERKFFAQPGESHELFYLNDSVVLTSAVLKDRDVISIGKTKLVFVPFCDERYGWIE